MDNLKRLTLTRVQCQWKKRPDEAYDYATYDRSANRSLRKPGKDTMNNTEDQLEHNSAKPSYNAYK